MNELEQRLQRALICRADQLSVAEPVPKIPQRRPHRHDSRRRSFVAVAAAVLLVLTVIAAVKVRDEKEPPTPAERLRQKFSHSGPLFELTSDGTILAIEPGTGAITTIRLPDGARRPVSISRSATGTTILTVAAPHPSPCVEPAIVSLQPDGTTSAPIASGWLASISPDGERVAYLTGGSSPSCGDRNLVMRDLATGTERRWRSEPNQGSQHVTSTFAWSPDGRSLAFGTYDAWLRVLELGAPGDTLAGARAVHHFRLLQQHPVWSAATGKLYGSDSFTQGPDYSPLQEIDPATGRVVRDVVHDNGGPFAISPDGQLVAYLVREPDHRVLRFHLRMTDGSATITVAEGPIVMLAW